jgi:hypothetical protein
LGDGPLLRGLGDVLQHKLVQPSAEPTAVQLKLRRAAPLVQGGKQVGFWVAFRGASAKLAHMSTMVEPRLSDSSVDDDTTLESVEARLNDLYDEIERLSAALAILIGPAPSSSPVTEATSEEAIEDAIARSSVLAEPPEMARYLQTHLGQQLTAYLAGLRDQKTVGQWARGNARPPALTRERLRVAYAATKLFVRIYGDDPARGWFFGANASLDDRSPASMLRDAETPDELATIVPLARAFVRGGH